MPWCRSRHREYLWVLSRTPPLSAADDAAIRERLKVQGFDLTRLQTHPQAATAPARSIHGARLQRTRHMFGISDFGAFCAAILFFLALPGPGTFALLTSTAKGGFRAGAAATLGVIVGDQVLLWLAVGGVAALLAAHPTAFQVVQYAGAAYLAGSG